MEIENKIKLEILKVLREDRKREFGGIDIWKRVRETLQDVGNHEVEEALNSFISKGMAFRRYIGDPVDAVYELYSLTKRKDNVQSNPDYIRREREWLFKYKTGAFD